LLSNRRGPRAENYTAGSSVAPLLTAGGLRGVAAASIEAVVSAVNVN
jgi:hypothetical protein